MFAFIAQGNGITNYSATFLASDVAAVPEPASWALMIGGMGMIAGKTRRRKSKVTTKVAFA